MKRHVFVAILLCVCTLGAFAKGKQPVTFKNLPEPVQKVIAQDFKPDQVQFITSEKVLGTTYYEFVMKEGTTIKYDAKAKLRTVKNKKGVAKKFIPANIAKYIVQTFPNTIVTKYKKETSCQKVDLNDEMTLVFTTGGNFLRIED